VFFFQYFFRKDFFYGCKISEKLINQSFLSYIQIKEGEEMAYIIAEPCIGVKDTACTEVCPVDCIHPKKDEADFEKEEQLYIDPDECIDCGACEPVCPVSAIFPESSLPEKWKSFIEKNANYYKRKKEAVG
jgi:ferredoxin